MEPLPRPVFFLCSSSSGGSPKSLSSHCAEGRPRLRVEVTCWWRGEELELDGVGHPPSSAAHPLCSQGQGTRLPAACLCLKNGSCDAYPRRGWGAVLPKPPPSQSAVQAQAELQTPSWCSSCSQSSEYGGSSGQVSLHLGAPARVDPACWASACSSPAPPPSFRSPLPLLPWLHACPPTHHMKF